MSFQKISIYNDCLFDKTMLQFYCIFKSSLQYGGKPYEPNQTDFKEDCRFRPQCIYDSFSRQYCLCNNGNYILAIDGVEALNIGVANLEHVSSDPGYYNGTFDLSFSSAMIDATSAESTDANPLAGIGAVLKISSDPKSETSSIEFALTTSGAALAILSITGGYSDGVQVPDFESLGETYHAASDESMTGYLESINWDSFLANIRSAGVPEEFAVQLESILKAAVESVLTPEENLETESVDAA